MKEEIDELCSIPIKILLESTVHKQFFTQHEFESNYATITKVAHLRNKLYNEFEKLKTLKK